MENYKKLLLILKEQEDGVRIVLLDKDGFGKPGI